MISERTTLIRLIALCLALVPLPAAFAYSETDLATLKETGSCAGCDLSGADLYEADLFRADLSLSDLSGADLTAADLTLANLRGVDLRRAILEEANLSGATLANALLDQNALAGAVFDSERTRTTLGFKDLKLGMNVMEIAQYCSIESIDTKTDYLTNNLNSSISQLEGTCFDNADMPFVFKFSGGGTTGVLNFLQVGLAPYTEKGHRKFIDLLTKKYEPMRSYSAADVAAFNKDRGLEGQSLDTIFANGQVTLSVVSRGTGLQLLLSYRAEDNGQRFLDRKGGPAPIDLTQLPAVTTDLYKLVGNYSLKGIGTKGTNANHGRIDTAYLEIDAFENELAGELAISGTGMSGRFRITGIEKISSNRLTVQLEPVTDTIPDGRPLRMSLEFAEDGDSFTGRWTNWFRLKHSKTRRPDDFKGVRSQSFWQTAMSHNRIDMYQAYLRLHPGGIYSAVARSRITELGGALVAPSAPTVSPDTPATPSATTPVDPLVGIWRYKPIGPPITAHLIVGMDDRGGLAGFQWHSSNNSALTFGFREISIESLSDGSYSWHTDQPLSIPVNPNWPLRDAVKEGKFWLDEAEAGLSIITSSKALFATSAGHPDRQPLEKLSYEEAVALKLPPEVPQDFPSPFATEGLQVASVPEATASAATVTTTPVDPLVGIWRWQGGGWGNSDRCYLAVGMTSDGKFEAKGWETIRKVDVDPSERIIGFKSGRVIVGVRDFAITRIGDQAYSWESDKSLPTFSSGSGGGTRLAPDMVGQFSIATGKTSLYANSRVCRKVNAEPAPSTYQKLSLEKALALELPPELLEGFPSPFVTESQQVASVSEATASASTSTPATTTATPTAVDPLVGIWTQTSRRYGNCYFIVGQRADGALAAVSFQNFLKRNVIGNDGPIEWGLTDTGVGILARTISIKPAPKGAYSWESAENFQTLGLPTFLANPPKKGRFFLSKDKDGNPRVTSNKKLCVEEPASPPTGTFRKLSLDDAIALELPSIAHEGFPSPFVTEGQQVASASATSSAATATEPVDPLVGIWHWQGGFWGYADSCYLAVGMNNEGELVGKSWETHQKIQLDAFFLGEEIIGFNIVGVRDITIGQADGNSYTWETEETHPRPLDYWTKGAMKGRLYLNMDGQNAKSLTVNNRICRKMRSEPKNSRLKKLSRDEALALELPPEMLEGFPSPFQEGTRRSGDVATEATGATQTTDAPEDSSESDRR